ncbi:four helix bundle protein [Longibacter sp.]|uniref:four helix bundle protein n=1 Tax=Longibacter sp. TaxID=2045415 RepID=UPI003EBF5B2C
MVCDVKDRRVDRGAFDCADEILRLSMGWPLHEQYAITVRIRRSSRSVFANIG